MFEVRDQGRLLQQVEHMSISERQLTYVNIQLLDTDLSTMQSHFGLAAVLKSLNVVYLP